MKFSNIQLFLQIKGYDKLANKFKIPIDIMEYIIYLVYFRDELLENEYKLFYKNVILFNLMGLPRPGQTLRQKCKIANPPLKELKNVFDSFERDVFNYRLPQGRNIEWGIKYHGSPHSDYVNARVEPFVDTILCIKILSEPDYLIFLDNNGWAIPASKKDKMKYINSMSIDKLYRDYCHYLEYKSTKEEWMYKVFINHNRFMFS